MNQELFNKYFLDPKRWIKKSRELMISAHYLVVASDELFRVGDDKMAKREGCLERHPFEAWNSTGSSASLLIGFALENALKGHLIEKGLISLSENGKIIGLNAGHDLISMIEDSDFEPTDSERESIALLTYQLQSLGRYHLARNLKKQNEFTGRVDNPASYYMLSTKIICSILGEENRKYFLEFDSSYDHIPRRPNFSEIPVSELLRVLKGRNVKTDKAGDNDG